MLDKLNIVHVARVFFLELIRNRSEQEVQFGLDVFINPPGETERHNKAEGIDFL